MVLKVAYGLVILSLCFFPFAYGNGSNQVHLSYEPLVSRLLGEGFDQELLSGLFADARAEPIPERMSISFGPSEGPEIYEPFLNRESILLAKTFLRENSKILKEMESRFQVDKEGVVAMLLMESRFGENIGRWRVFPTLASMAIVDSPENIRSNYEKLSGDDPALTYERVEGVAKRKAIWAYQELKCYLKIIRDGKFDPLEIRGSYAGALGIAQFVPSSYLAFAWSKNGFEKWLLSKEEAILSVGNYLKSNGWKKSLTREKKKDVLWRYNRSQPYIETVLKIANQLKPKAR